MITLVRVGMATLLAVAAAGCSSQRVEPVEVARFPLDQLSEIVAVKDVAIDSQISSDGQAAVRIASLDSANVPLVVVENPDVDDCRLIYRARVRTENLAGKAFLEMWCQFEGRGEFFSRDLQTPVTGNTDWTTEETYFLLRKGEKPNRVRLNLVVNGTGLVWADDLRLLKAAK